MYVAPHFPSEETIKRDIALKKQKTAEKYLPFLAELYKGAVADNNVALKNKVLDHINKHIENI